MKKQVQKDESRVSGSGSREATGKRREVIDESRGVKYVEVSRQDMLYGVGCVLVDIRKFIAAAKKKYGKRYKQNNEYERFLKLYGDEDPEVENEKVLTAFDQLRTKQLKQPVVIRTIIEHVGNYACQYAYKRGLTLDPSPKGEGSE